MGEVEILAPAGEWACLEAAIGSGCDAVYFGVEGLNMRSSARNFRTEELPRIVSRCREAGVLAYLTLNALVYDREFEVLDGLLDAAAAAGVDAVIASDLAVVAGASQRGLEVHVSTQMSIANSRSLAELARHYGIRRFVLARECTLDDINLLRENLAKVGVGGIELEAFAHGAMCVAVSGRCFMSQFQYGKSANRGECLQPCRREYRIVNDEEDQEFALGSDYVMSPQDLCTLPFVEKLLETGIRSLKIEGRNRSPEYTATVTRAYRSVVDFYLQHKDDPGFAGAFELEKAGQLKRLQRVFHRGLSNGFFMGRPMEAWTESGGSQATVRKFYVGPVTNYYARVGAAEVLVQDNAVRCGDEGIFIGPTTGVLEQLIESMQIEHAAVEQADKGMLVAIKTAAPVRRGDKLYVVRDVEGAAGGTG